MAKPDPTSLVSLLEAARSFSLLLPETPTYDVVASALSFKLALEHHFDKPISVSCASPMTVEFNRLVGVDSVTTSAPSTRSLVISFPGQTELVDRVNYDLVHGELQLVIIPKPDAPLIDPRQLKYSGGSHPADLIITFGVNALTDLGEIYTGAKDFFTEVKIVSLTRDLPRENFTNYQVYDPQASSLSELVTHLINSLRFQIDSDIASNLLAGLEQGTRQFQDTSVSASTFEAATFLMQRGARRHDVYQPDHLPAGAIPQAPRPSRQAGFGTDDQPAEPTLDSEAAPSTPPTSPSSDWYEPKVYQGSMLQ